MMIIEIIITANEFLCVCMVVVVADWGASQLSKRFVID